MSLVRMTLISAAHAPRRERQSIMYIINMAKHSYSNISSDIQA